MYDFVQIIKQCALDALEAQRPIELLLGRVTQAEDVPNDVPLEITLQQKSVIGREFLFDTDSTYDLKKDTCILLLRQRGGQRYLVLTRLREDDENDT